MDFSRAHTPIWMLIMRAVVCGRSSLPKRARIFRRLLIGIAVLSAIMSLADALNQAYFLAVNEKKPAYSFNASMGGLWFATEPTMPPQDFRALLDAHAVMPNFIVITAANYAHLNFTLNWVESMRHNNFDRDKFLVAALDDEILGELRNRSIPVFSALAACGIEQSVKEEAYFQAPTYIRLTNSKIAIVLRIMEEHGYSVFFSDADTAWLDPIVVPYMWQKLHGPKDHYEMMMESDSWDEPDYAGTGVYAIRPTPMTSRLWREVLAKNGSDNDQFIFKEMRKTLPAEDMARIGLAPMALITGGLFGTALAEKTRVPPWIVHANWRMGIHPKRDLLKSFGAWYLND